MAIPQATTTPPTETEPESPQQNVVTGLARGVGKSAVGLVQGIGTLGRGIQRGISKGVGAITGAQDFGLGAGSPFDRETEAGKWLTALATPQTGAEKVGKFVGDVASFAVPGGGVARATRGASTLTRAAAQVASDVGVQLAQQGTFDRNLVDTAILSAVFPALGAIKNVARLKIGQRAGTRIINSLVKPLLKDFSYGKNPGKAVAESGIIANSLDDLAEKIGQQRQATGQTISQVVAGAKGTFDVEDALTPLDEAIAGAQKAPRTNASVISRLQNLKDDILQTGEETTRKLKSVTAPELWQMKQDVGELTKWTGNASDDAMVNKALKGVFGRLKAKMDTIPGTPALNERYANLKSAEIATVYRDKIVERQNLLSLPTAQLGTGAALLTALASGGALTPSLLAGVGMSGLRYVVGTPAGKTRLASWLASASPQEKQTLFRQIPWFRSVLQSAFFGNTGREEESINGSTKP